MSPDRFRPGAVEMKAGGRAMSTPVGGWRRHKPDVRSEKITVRLTAAERDRLRQAAQEAGLRLGGWLAELGLAAGAAAPSAPAASQAELAALQAASLQLRRYATNVNQAVAQLHATGTPPVWLADAVRLANGAASRVDDLCTELRRTRGAHKQ
jgi:hypothetical protein